MNIGRRIDRKELNYESTSRRPSRSPVMRKKRGCVSRNTTQRIHVIIFISMYISVVSNKIIDLPLLVRACAFAAAGGLGLFAVAPAV